MGNPTGTPASIPSLSNRCLGELQHRIFKNMDSLIVFPLTIGQPIFLFPALTHSSGTLIHGLEKTLDFLS